MLHPRSLWAFLLQHSLLQLKLLLTQTSRSLLRTALLKYGVRPIICCGESLAQREAGETFDWIKGQIVGAFKDIPADKLCQITIAYEPIWAIGTGKTATDEQAEEVCKFIRGVIAELYCPKCAEAMTIATSALRLSPSSTVVPATLRTQLVSSLSLTSTAAS